MAYSLIEKTAFATRLTAVKQRFAERGIKYYATVARALDETVNGKTLHNVMNGTQWDEKSLLLLEKIAGIEKEEAVLS